LSHVKIYIETLRKEYQSSSSSKYLIARLNRADRKHKKLIKVKYGALNNLCMSIERLTGLCDSDPDFVDMLSSFTTLV